MASETKLKIVVDAENRTNQAFQSVNTSLSSITGTMKTVGAIGAVAFTAVAAGLYKAVDAAAEAAKVDAQLEAVLRSTSHAAGLFKEDLEDQAKALQRMTTFDDEAVKSVEALLLTFTNIKGAVFQQALPAILDMSVALGQDLKSSAIQVGKALNDPINGITALRRVGVAFTDEQQAVIAALVETGQTAEAQRMILKELGTEFGGSASAQAATYAGQLTQLKNRFGDLQESVGGTIIPVLVRLLNAIAPVIEKTIAWADAHPKLAQNIIFLTVGLTALLAILYPLALIITGLSAMWTALSAVTLASLVPFAAVIAIIAILVASLWAMNESVKLVQEHWADIWLGIKVIAAEAVNSVIGFVENMTNSIIDDMNNVIRMINRVIALAQKVPGVGRLIPKIGEIGRADFGRIDTGTIAANDLAGRANPVSTKASTVVVTGNTFLSETIAEQIGDMIIGRLKLSTNL